MQLKVVWKAARAAAIELDSHEIFKTAKPWKVYLDDEYWGETSRVVTYIDGLEPRHVYHVIFEQEGQTASTMLVTGAESFTLDVMKFGAYADGVHDDTLAIQAAIAACPAEGRVLIPKGNYLISSLFLKSHMSLELAEGAYVRARFDRENLFYLPGNLEGAQGKGYAGTNLLPLGTWEGESCDMFCGAIMGLSVDHVLVYGRGVLDGQASFDEDNWWFEAKKIRRAARPRLIFLNDCHSVTFAGITVRNSPSWNIHPVLSSNLGFWCLNIENPKDSPNTDGLDPESCCNVTIKGCHFSVGDDCIAIKSGKLSQPRGIRPPCRDLLIEQCYMHDGHGSIVVGSEASGGVSGLTARNCLFERTDRGLRVKTRRGRGKDSILSGISFENLHMDEVLVPFVINSFYFCDKDGKTDYVQNREALPVDERTPKIESVVFRDIVAHRCHAAAAYITGLPESKIERLEFYNIELDYADNPEPFRPAMANNVPDMTRQGIIAEHVNTLVLSNVRITGQDGEKLQLEDVDSLEEV